MNVLLIGSDGKMGQKMQTVLSKSGHIFLGIDKDNREDAHAFNADVIIDFSSSSCLKENVALAKEKRVPIVIATTNHDKSNLSFVEESAREIPIFMSSNFSFMFQILLEFAELMNTLSDCDFAVEEIHHRHKKDSPSGSCKEIIKKLEEQNINPQVSALRVGEIVGIHSLQVYSSNECLKIKHQVFDRAVFCEGALKAAQFLLKKSPGLYSMKDLLQN